MWNSEDQYVFDEHEDSLRGIQDDWSLGHGGGGCPWVETGQLRKWGSGEDLHSILRRGLKRDGEPGNVAPGEWAHIGT